jgi:hypothetical protein
MTLRPGITPRREKGQPEGNAINSDTGWPGVAGTHRKTRNAAGRNNSNAILSKKGPQTTGSKR